MRDSTQKPQEQRLVAEIQNGNEEAFEKVIRLYYEELCNYVETQIGHSSSAEDLVQDVFLNLWRRRREWNPRTTLRAYLFGAVRNESIKHRKRRRVRHRWKQEQRETASLDAPGPHEDLRHRELEQAFREHVAELPERRRQVFVLSRHHGLTYKEIAAVMDISPSTVDNQMVKALRFLRERLGTFLSSPA